jgi:hypothetical protein
MRFHGIRLTDLCRAFCKVLKVTYWFRWDMWDKRDRQKDYSCCLVNNDDWCDFAKALRTFVLSGLAPLS